MSGEMIAATRNGFEPQTRNCTNCAFAMKENLPPPNIGSQFSCKFMPPQMVVMPSPQGAQLVTMFPVVNERMLCNQHTLVSQIENGPQGAANS